MAGGRRRRAARALALCCVLATALAAPPIAAGESPTGGARAEVASRALAQRPIEVREYWTAARLRAAEPARLIVGPQGSSHALPGGAVAPRTATDASAANTAYPDRTHGKVFFTIRGGSSPGDYSCSGTVVESPAHTLVWTAGHCVNDAEFGGGFASNWMFVPAYRSGQRPFGGWVARELFTTDGWRKSANFRLDLGAAAVARDAEGRGIEDVVGTREIVFGQSRDQTFTAFGYPATPTPFRPEFDGERLYACTSPRTADDRPPGGGPPTMEINCDMDAGSSGGGWVTPAGAVNGIVSYGYVGDFNHLYGPYFGVAAEQLHAAAGGEAVLCGRREVTNLGTAGRDDFDGGVGEDVMALGDGRDRARGGPSGDELCGGRAGDDLRGGAGRDAGRGARGHDTLRGGAGRDVLRGGRGADLLAGGRGRDLCSGGPGHDRARGCEVVRGVP